jgi:hypothetical protein
MIMVADALKPSTPDIAMLVFSIEERFLALCNRYKRKWGIDLPIDKSTRGDMLLWRMAFRRHRKKDIRHTDSEIKAIKSFAQWTVDQNCLLAGQPTKKIEWSF